MRYAWGEASARRLATELPSSPVAFVAYPHIDHELDESMVRGPLIWIQTPFQTQIRLRWVPPASLKVCVDSVPHYVFRACCSWVTSTASW